MDLLPGVRLVLGEVERPDLFEAHPEHGDPARRLAFYARLGAGALTLPYYQPPSSEGMPRIPGLLLVALATTDATPLPRMLSAEETDAVRSYLLSAMGAPAEGDVETQAAFAAVDAPPGFACCRWRTTPRSHCRRGSNRSGERRSVSGRCSRSCRPDARQARSPGATGQDRRRRRA